MFAGPGTGKSTTSAAVFSLLKMHGVNAELITEFAKDLTWEKRHMTMSNQYYIWAKQHHRMWRIKDQVEVMVTDSPLLLGLIYGGEKPDCFNETVLHSFNEFNNVNYFLLREKKYNPKGRIQTEEEAKELDGEISLMLSGNSIGFNTVHGNFAGANTIAECVLRRLGKEMEIQLNTPLITVNPYSEVILGTAFNPWVETTKEEIYNAMLMPGEYVERDGKFYIKRGMLDGYICEEYYQSLETQKKGDQNV
jgi:hypothetical protein